MFSTNTNKYKLFNEDALSLLSRIPTSSIDLILTDPPYNIALNSTGNIKLTNGKTINNDIAEWDKYSINPLDYVKDFKRVISPKGNIFIFTSYSLLGKWHEAFDKEFKTFQLFVWHKTRPIPIHNICQNNNSIHIRLPVWIPNCLKPNHWNDISGNIYPAYFIHNPVSSGIILIQLHHLLCYLHLTELLIY